MNRKSIRDVAAVELGVKTAGFRYAISMEQVEEAAKLQIVTLTVGTFPTPHFVGGSSEYPPHACPSGHGRQTKAEFPPNCQPLAYAPALQTPFTARGVAGMQVVKLALLT
jgi:hypothetical protein